MTYPGNPSLAAETQRKILDTFSQSLNLASSGRREEALLGCDFVLRLDPLFEPARILQERVEAAPGPVSVDDLTPAAPASAPSAPTPDVPTPTATAPAPPPPAPAAAEAEPETEIDAQMPAPAAPEVTSDQPFDLGQITAPDVDARAAALESALDFSSLTPDAEAEPETEAEEVAEEPAAPAEPTEQITAADSEPEVALDQESEQRIGQLLEEGQAAFDTAEYQSAIDAWSRIFLIDIEHPEANRRIELARKLKAEVERKVEEAYHDALDKLEAGNLEDARDAFARVVSMQPSHLAAQEYLDRLSRGDFEPSATPPIEPAPDEVLEPLPRAELELPVEDLPDLFDGDLEMAEGAFEAPPAAEAARPVAAPAGSRRTLLAVAGVVLIAILAGIWMLYSNWDRAFPSADEDAAAAAARVDPIARATSLQRAGQTSMAIAQLRRLPPAHPQYAEAQTLIAQWETAIGLDQDAGPSVEQIAERDRLVAEAREAFANRELLSAEELFALASQAAPLDDGAAALQAETVDRLTPLRSEIEIFRQGEWAYALRSLWPKYEADPGNPDIVRLMVDGYYNLAVRDLQRDDPLAALTSLSEASALDASDPQIQRLLGFASAYQQREQDLLYRIFVKYLPFR